MHPRRVVVCLLLAAALAGCGMEPLADAPGPPAGLAPTLDSSPQVDRDRLAAGGELGVWLSAQGEHPLHSVRVNLVDEDGVDAGEAALSPAGTDAWQGPLVVEPMAQAGLYAVEVTLNDGAFVSGGSLRQTLYRFDAFLSAERYRESSNAISIEGSQYRITPQPSALSPIALTTVQIDPGP